ncbi:MAG: stage IV sporulation protein A [Dysosmobacter sp.]
MNRSTSMYQDMASRTGSSIYIGVVGPVRTGKSTFIKRFMETQVLPNIENDYRRERARDELPQSGSGRTIMTAEPKFVPEEAAEVRLPDGTSFSVRLIDCVGYMVPGAVGQFEDLAPRMVMTPWYDHEIPMTEAAELGTRKVICDHSTVGIVVTTDGSVTDIPRSDYLEAEERVIRELQELGSPLVLVNSCIGGSPSAGGGVAAEYGVRCLAVNCLELGKGTCRRFWSLLYEFPVQELQLFFPEWVEALPPEHPIPAGLYHAVGQEARRLEHVRQLEGCMAALEQSEQIRSVMLRQMDLGTGVGQVEVQLPRSLFYDTVNQQTGLSITDDGDLMEQLVTLAGLRKEYDRVAQAVSSARSTGYGVVMPSVEELELEDPEIVRQGGRYGVRMKASAPSIHMLRADVSTTVSPIVGNEKQSQDMVNYLLQEFEGEPGKLWESNIFGRSFHEIVGEDLQAKLKRMPEDSQKKLREALERILNEGSGGLICIIL